MSSGRAVKLLSRTSPWTPKPPAMAPTQTVSLMVGPFRCGVSSRHHRDILTAAFPSGKFEFGRVALGLGPADAEIGDKPPIGWNIKVLGEAFGIEDRHPAEAQPVGAGGQPEL